jgi:hypothetical protein
MTRRALIAVVAVSALALLSAAVLSGCESSTSQAPSQKVLTMLKDLRTAMNAGDAQAVAKFYAANAVMDNYADGGANVQGSTAISEYLSGIATDFSMQWNAAGDPVQYDRYVVEQVANTQKVGTGTGATLQVYELDPSGQIAHEWIVGWVNP